MRLFIAIPLKAEIKDNIEESAKILKQYTVKGSFPKKETYHITLAFLGDVEEDRIPLLRSIMDMCKVEAFPLSIEGLDYFKKKDGDIVYREVESTRRLYNLQDKLSRLLKKNGFELDTRPFEPHITLARRVVYHKRYDIQDVTEDQKLLELEGAQQNASCMKLMLSEQVKGGMKYTPLYNLVFDCI